MIIPNVDTKYELTGYVCRIKGNVKVYEIRALRDIERYNVRRGDLGGYIESEYNLSQQGDCWIEKQCYVYNEGQVLDDAYVGNHSKVYDKAILRDQAQVLDGGEAYGNAKMFGESKIKGGVIRENAIIKDDSVICRSWVSGSAQIIGKSVIQKGAFVSGSVELHNSRTLGDFIKIGGNDIYVNQKFYATL